MAIFIEGAGTDKIENADKIFGNLVAEPRELLEAIAENYYRKASVRKIKGWIFWDSVICKGSINNRIYFFEITGIVQCQ